MAQIKCGGVYFPASFTIIENQQTDILMGLDLLKRHQCCIDLKYHCLRIGETATVPFLSEAEIQQSLSDNMLRSLLDQPSELGVSAISDLTASGPPPGVSLVNLTSSRPPGVSTSNPQTASAAEIPRTPSQRTDIRSGNISGRVQEETKVKL
eukprot:Gregarina_sp_Poly_1__5544@NODE_2928_length_1538_cov_131_989803_g1847_i0_p2_GENE_NODE_2928_length_1538_cov_131_989803_g1847_i0NODE_2928_length_1538_cov_131_989803_g1847_i0_p2_ORF_typecomplete_len152_score25_95Asp_protease/PF09668_10/2_3e11RVP_2/PF08284_11/6e05gagasp_proteas/PF13975_6/0_93gagasp_proteas/PF13975_6/3_4e02_NODE_2928_length_1538_cov_131_989803_g1847_i0124579